MNEKKEEAGVNESLNRILKETLSERDLAKSRVKQLEAENDTLIQKMEVLRLDKQKLLEIDDEQKKCLEDMKGEYTDIEYELGSHYKLEDNIANFRDYIPNLFGNSFLLEIADDSWV